MRVERNAVRDNRLKKCEPIDRAMHRGIYIGSPGKDIFYMLPYLSEEQMQEVAKKFSKQFPIVPPTSYVNVAACIRFIYGQFEKQGILRSQGDFERMRNEKLDWELSRKFLGFLYKEFEKRNNYYGLSMLCEMEGHRLGDEAVINRDKNKLREMEEIYNKSVEFAYKCNGYKHLFSIYYWMSQYFKKFGDEDEALKYSKLSILNACKYYHKYFPNGEDYYSKRLFISFNYIKKKGYKGWNDFYKKYKKNVKGKKLKRVLEKIGKI